MLYFYFVTEWEKAKTGLLYDANYDPQIQKLHDKALGIMYQMRNTDPSEKDKLNALVRTLLGRIGERFVIEMPFFCGFGSNIFIGDDFYANYNCTIVDNAEVIIGNHVFLAPNVGIHTAGHPLEAELRNKGLEYARSVHIKDNVWIGAGAQILPGVTIGESTVIGAGSIVTHDIPSNVVAVGNPCKVIKTIGKENI